MLEPLFYVRERKYGQIFNFLSRKKNKKITKNYKKIKKNLKI